MALETVSPYVRLAMDSYVAKPWHVRERQLWDYEILYLQEGRIRVTVEEREYEGEAGDIFVFRPRVRHSIRLVGERTVRQPHVHFDLNQLPDSAEVGISFAMETAMSDKERGWFRADALAEAGVDLPERLRLLNPLVFEKLLHDLIAEFRLKMPYYELNLKGMLVKLLIHIMREHHWAKTPHVGGRITELLRVQAYLNHQTGREVSLDDLSATFNWSKYYLTRLFKSAFGMSPIHYHQLVRLERAKELIRFTTFSMTEIADMVGFPNIHAFSRAFKAKEGVPPSAYRR